MMTSTDLHTAGATQPHQQNPCPQLSGKRFFAVTDWLAEHTGRSVPAIVDIEQLRSLSVGSFGRAWADSLDEQGLTALSTGPRRKQLHDGIHVLTGYSTDPLGEAEVQAFLLGAKFHVAQILLGLALLPVIRIQVNSSNRTLTKSIIRDRLWAAYQRGVQSTFDPDTWQPEWLWEQSLETVQMKFNV
ncbi:MAG: hypothetical protein AAFR31_08245 [Cyanobacteria bacterium J06627_8]